MCAKLKRSIHGFQRSAPETKCGQTSEELQYQFRWEGIKTHKKVQQYGSCLLSSSLNDTVVNLSEGGNVLKVFDLFYNKYESKIVNCNYITSVLTYRYFSLHGTVPPLLQIRENPANTKHLYNICTMLDQRRRRWAGVV